MVLHAVVQLANIGTQVTEAFAGLDRIREIRRMATEDDEDMTRNAMPEVRGEVAFDDVTFEYNPDVPVLSLRHVPQRRKDRRRRSSAQARSGKSTLISLVMAFAVEIRAGCSWMAGRSRRSETGDCRISASCCRTTSCPAWHARAKHRIREASCVARGNRGGRQDRPLRRVHQEFEAEVRHDRRRARCAPVRWPAPAHRHRARDPRGSPRVSSSDEATSSLDVSKALIQDGLKALRKGRTSFVFAHRLSTNRASDQILVLAHGEIVERGTHQELLAHDGRYKQLYDKQYRFEKDQFINPGGDLRRSSPPPKTPAFEQRSVNLVNPANPVNQSTDPPAKSPETLRGSKKRNGLTSPPSATMWDRSRGTTSRCLR